MSAPDSVLPPTFTQDGTQFVVLGGGTSARIRSAKTGEPDGEDVKDDEEVVGVSFSRDGRFIVTGNSHGGVVVWDVRSRKRMAAAQVASHSEVNGVAFTPDGRSVLATFKNGEVRVLRLDGPGTQLAPLASIPEAREEEPIAPEVSADGRFMLAEFEKVVGIWDAHTGERRASFLPPSKVRTASFAPDGSRVAVGTGGSLQLYASDSGRPIGWALPGSHIAVFSPDGSRLIANERIHDVPAGEASSSELIATFLNVVAGIETNSGGGLVPLINRTQRLEELFRLLAAAPDGEGSTKRIINWYLADPSRRSVSPLSELSIQDYIRECAHYAEQRPSCALLHAAGSGPRP
jgi:hypothetical protein